MNSHLNKDQLRKEQLAKLQNISDKTQQEAETLDQLFANTAWMYADVVATTMSRDFEFDTSQIRTADKTILVPRLENDEMVFVAINQNAEFIKSSNGILEPVGEPYVGPIDLLIVPGLAFTEDGNRLGFGGGHFDKFLADRPEIPTIALALNEQLLESIPVEKHDIKIKEVIY